MKNGRSGKITIYYLMVFFYWMSLYFYPPQLSVYSGLLGASSSMTGIILGSYGFSQMLLRVPLGLLSDKLRKRKLFVSIGASVSILSAVGFCFAGTPEVLLVCRTLAGVAASAWVTFTVLFSSYFDAKEAPASMSRLMLFNNFGTLVGMLAGGYIAQYLGTKFCFVASIFAGTATLVLSFFIMENVPEKPVVKEKFTLNFKGHKLLFFVSFAAMFLQVVEQGTTSGFTPKLVASLGGSSLEIGYVSAAAKLGGMLATILNTKWLLKKLGAIKCCTIGIVLYATSIILLPIVSQNVPTLLLFQFLAGIGMGAGYPLLMGLAVSEVESSRKGLAMGIFQSVYALGMFIGPAITGVLSETLSLGTTISIMGCVAPLALICILLSQKMYPKK